jgi:exonuclease SbcC
MIPHRLRLCNFMCYREEQVLDFSGIHLACLTGDNGHGKSTLLDAMTWVLWGKARSNSADDLISLGVTDEDMWVDFEFVLGAQRYRVWRQRSRRGQGRTDLHFYIWNAAGDDWQLLDEGGINERQNLITRTLRMEYDTFVNSAFVLQGKADSFTVKRPAERKKVLADILGLNRYDDYEARAKEQFQARREDAGRIQGEMDVIDRELAQRPQFEAQLIEARTALEVVEKELRAHEAEQTRLQQVLSELRSKRARLVELDARVERMRRDLDDLRSGIANAQARLTSVEATLARRAEIEGGWEALQQARHQSEAFNDRLTRVTRFQEQIGQAQRAMDQGRAELQADVRALEGRRAELDRRVETAAQQAAILEEARTILAKLDALQARRSDIAQELRDIGEQQGAARTAMETARIQGRNLNDKREKIDSLRDEATCPTCGQILSEEHRVRTLADLDGERSVLLDLYHEAQASVKALDLQRRALETEQHDLDTQLRARDARQQQVARTEQVVRDGEQAAQHLDAVNAEMAALEARLSANDYAHAERARLADLRTQLAELGYDEAAHAEARREADRLAHYSDLYQRQLLPALDSIGDLRSQVENLNAQVARREDELAQDMALQRQLQADVASWPESEQNLRDADKLVSDAGMLANQARQREGAAMQRLDALEQQAQRRVIRRAELDAVRVEMSLLSELQVAFGKKGVQAMIIETALPEIETEANRLLGCMTEGRMSLRLETQRETKDGTLQEVLEVYISDELGSRNYEMYSGGEAFRANLALRIAISKLLARRAGAQLQTLIIDEGFGTQDSQGRGLLVEAINSIQHDFERIIVITHIDEFKDLFPARIDVVKTSAGSRISVA